MHYPKRNHFEGLRQLAARLQCEAGLEPLGQSAQLREKGLKKAAQAAVDAFLVQANAATLFQRQQWASRIVQLAWQFPQVHPWPDARVVAQFLQPVLDTWDSPDGRRYRAWVSQDMDLLQASLAEDEHPEIRRALIGRLKEQIAYATHHLGESRLIGDGSVLQADLETLSRLAPETPHLPSMRQVLLDWQNYQLEPMGSFPDWCAQRGRSHRWEDGSG